MDFGHARRFATREARRFAGDLYPGPVLMPRGLLRALDPLLATALGPARDHAVVHVDYFCEGCGWGGLTFFSRGPEGWRIEGKRWMWRS